MSDAPLPDPLEQFLQAPPSLPADAALQQAILQRTSSLLPRPRARKRRWVLVGGIAASIALAFCAGWILSRSFGEGPAPRKEIVEHKKSEPVEETQPQRDEQKQVAAAAMPTHPRELEWAAFDTMEDHERARLYFRAGDSYLEKHNDISSALRCYRQAIASSGADELDLDPNDNWLVLALKHDYRKER